ncbi:unannotated protein [freshwater metagenome]|uniref:Unannotated protein n=1 Tax=freshwater metagenome TaxID=449393 RepID=A0A6J7FU84_9ZZZZ|nr:hypothetical protein [Actinomycetota bacterium]
MKQNVRSGQVLKNIVRSVSGVSFPIAGSVVVMYTLSGETRKVAVIATSFAIIGHIVHSTMALNDRDGGRAAINAYASAELDGVSDQSGTAI